MKRQLRLIYILLVITLPQIVSSQVVYEHISNKAIYEFLDEMTSLKVIELNDIIKPYSKDLIFEKLQEIQSLDKQHKTLNNRQKAELRFYLNVYITENPDLLSWPKGINIHSNIEGEILSKNPPGIYYKDKNFTFGFSPFLGASYFTNENGTLNRTYGGVSVYGYSGAHIGFYTSVRDNNVSEINISPNFLIQDQGIPFKDFGEDGIDYSEARGGITYDWKWGNIGLVKDNVEWGTGYNGTNIQSGRTPSFAMIKLNLKPVRWFEFNYFHGWLNSEVVDSTNSYYTNGIFRTVHRNKYIAANMFTFYPVRHLNVSFGNSVIYSDIGGVNAHFLIPFLFYKSVDHTLNSTNRTGESGQNSQMYFNISSRNIKNVHLYFTLYTDDLSFKHFKYKNEHNFFSYKAGFRLNNYPIQNLSLILEFTHTNPLVFKHKIETQTYETNSYNLGHYLGDNAREIYLAFIYKPIRGLNLKLCYTKAEKGGNPSYATCANDPNCDLHILPILDPVIWTNEYIGFNARYEIVANTYFFMDMQLGKTTGDVETFSPKFYWSKTTTISAGFNLGF